MKILRVNMTTLKTSFEALPEAWKMIGGKGLIAKIMNREVPPGVDPLGPENKLIFACGPLAGTLAPQLGRLSAGAKSPLTQGIKEANVGGPAGQKMDRLGIRAVVVEGDLEEIAFETSQDVPNLCGNPVPLKRSQILKVLKETY